MSFSAGARHAILDAMKNAWRPLIAGAAIIFLALMAYQPVWHAGFIWDDDDHLTANPAMTAPHGLRMIWSSLVVSRYYPLTLTSFWAERQLWGLNPLPFHLVNVLLHGINGILVYFLLRRLRIPAAWLAATLWTLHPVNVESVAWVTELKNTQSGVFFFCALLCFLRFEAHQRRRWYALALLCGAAALLSKPSTVVLPVVLLLCAWWERGGWRRTDWLRTAPFFGLALAMSALTILEQRGSVLRTGPADWSMGMAERFVLAGKAIWFYAVKVLWPTNLAFVYPRWEVAADLFWRWLPLAGVVAVGIVLYQRRREPWAQASAFGLGFFVLALLPVLGFFDVYYFRYSFVADHFQYLASAGLIALVASAGVSVCKRTGRLGRNIGVATASATLMMLAALTWRQGHSYRNNETLWRDVVRKNPNSWMAHCNLAQAYALAGRMPEAIPHWEQALRIKPDYAGAHNNLGDALVQQGRLPEAVGEFEQVLRLRPGDAGAHHNLANALKLLGKTTEAIGHWEEALRIKPDYAEAHNDFGAALAQMGKTTDAIAHIEEALRLQPDFAEAHNNLGISLVQAGRVPEAIAQYEQALQINPEYAEAHYNLGIALAQVDRVTEAMEHWQQALQIRPDYAEAHYNLGVTLAQMGRVPEAIAHYEQALQIKPDYIEAHNNLGSALLGAGKVEDAIRHLDEALRLQPNLAAAQYNLGLALERSGKPAEAIQYFEEALRLNPNLTDARNALTRLQPSQ